MARDTNKPEPPPVPNDQPRIVDLVVDDLIERAEAGRTKYGTYLQPHNGRRALVDAYQEALDLSMYLRQAQEEIDNLRELVEDLMWTDINEYEGGYKCEDCGESAWSRPFDLVHARTCKIAKVMGLRVE